MKLLILFIFLCPILSAEIVIDPRYDNYEGEVLVLKLIEDTQWSAAEFMFEKEKDTYLTHTPSQYYLIKGLLAEHSHADQDAVSLYEKSLSLKYSALGIEKLAALYLQTQAYSKGLAQFENFKTQMRGKRLTSEITLLKSAATQPSEILKVLQWTEDYLTSSFYFPLFKFYIDELIRNGLINQATRAADTALAQNKIKSAEETLTVAESFLSAGLDQNIHAFLERARLVFPNSDLVKLNLAQVMFKKDLLASALTLLSELNIDDGILNVQLELMNLMQVKSYSLFHRMQLKDGSSHLKNWFVYFINNEDWASLYALSARYKSAPWKNDEFSYAMAYSAQLVKDPVEARLFIDLVTSPSLSQKKDNLIKTLSSVQNY